jgi:hypothetical protein
VLNIIPLTNAELELGMGVHNAQTLKAQRNETQNIDTDVSFIIVSRRRHHRRHHCYYRP